MHNLRLSEEKNIQDVKRTKFPFNDASHYTKVQRKKGQTSLRGQQNAIMKCVSPMYFCILPVMNLMRRGQNKSQS